MMMTQGRALRIASALPTMCNALLDGPSVVPVNNERPAYAISSVPTVGE
jgi:hypothetical protein